MSSIKERIAMLNAKKPTTPTGPAVTVSNPAASIDGPDKAVKRNSLTKATGTKEGTESTFKLDDSGSTAPTNRRPSISERIAAMKLAQNSTAPEVTGDQSKINSDNIPIDSASPGMESLPVKRLSISDKVNALQNKSATASPTTVNTPNSVKRTSVDGVSSASSSVPETQTKELLAPTTSTSDQLETPVKRMSVAEKIAALKAKPETPKNEEKNKPTEVTPSADGASPVKRMSIADKIAALKAKPEIEKTDDRPKPSPKSQGIAERIAAMQVSAAAENSNSSSKAVPVPGRISIPDRNDNEEPVKSDSAPVSSRRLSTDKMKFAAGINLAGLSPMAPRPMIVKPKPVEDDDTEGTVQSDRKTLAAVGENGEIQHLNLSRASIRASVRRKGTSSRSAVSLEYGDEVITIPSVTTGTDLPTEAEIESEHEVDDDDR